MHPSGLELYFGFVEEAGLPEHLDTCRRGLTDEERARCERFHFERDRTLFTLAHALVRKVLGEKLGVEGRTLRFEEGPHGRPELAGPHARALSFNLSHTPGLVVLAVAPAGSDVGVDTELENPRRATLDVARRSFSPSELAHLLALPEEDRLRRFYALWTLKESFIKAKGTGLTMPLDRFSYDLEALPRLSVEFAPSLGESPRDWRFGLMRGGSEHPVAYGLRWPSDAGPLTVVARRVRSLDAYETLSPQWVGRTDGGT